MLSRRGGPLLAPGTPVWPGESRITKGLESMRSEGRGGRETGEEELVHHLLCLLLFDISFIIVIRHPI